MRLILVLSGLAVFSYSRKVYRLLDDSYHTKKSNYTHNNTNCLFFETIFEINNQALSKNKNNVKCYSFFCFYLNRFQWELENYFLLFFNETTRLRNYWFVSIYFLYLNSYLYCYYYYYFIILLIIILIHAKVI